MLKRHSDLGWEFNHFRLLGMALIAPGFVQFFVAQNH